MTKRGPVFGEFTTTPNAGQYINEGAIALSQLMELFPDKLDWKYILKQYIFV